LKSEALKLNLKEQASNEPTVEELGINSPSIFDREVSISGSNPSQVNQSSSSRKKFNLNLQNTPPQNSKLKEFPLSKIAKDPVLANDLIDSEPSNKASEIRNSTEDSKENTGSVVEEVAVKHA
jgi:hypothetical protein